MIRAWLEAHRRHAAPEVVPLARLLPVAPVNDVPEGAASETEDGVGTVMWRGQIQAAYDAQDEARGVKK